MQNYRILKFELQNYINSKAEKKKRQKLYYKGTIWVGGLNI